MGGNTQRDLECTCLETETELLLMVLQRAIVKERFHSNVKNSTNVYVTIDLIQAPLQ